MHVLGHGIPAVGNVPALAEQRAAVLVGELHGMMIEDLAEVVLVAIILSPALPLSSDRIVVHDPVDNVEIMNVLLDDVVATEPVELIPVPHLELQLRPLLLPLLEPGLVAV